MSRVCAAAKSSEPSAPRYLKEGEAAARQLGLTVLPFEFRSPDQVEIVFEEMKQAKVQALAFAPGGLLFQ